MSNIVISAVPPQMTEYVWPDVEEHLARVVEVSNGEITLDTVKEKLLFAQLMLLTISEGKEIIAAITVDVRVFDSGKKVLVAPMIGGSRMDEWLDQLINVLKGIAKIYQCEEVRGIAARRGWLKKLPEWDEVHTTIRLKIGDE